MIWTIVLWLGMQGQAIWTTPSEPNVAILMRPQFCKNLTAHWVNGQLESSACEPPKPIHKKHVRATNQWRMCDYTYPEGTVTCHMEKLRQTY